MLPLPQSWHESARLLLAAADARARALVREETPDTADRAVATLLPRPVWQPSAMLGIRSANPPRYCSFVAACAVMGLSGLASCGAGNQGGSASIDGDTTAVATEDASTTSASTSDGSGSMSATNTAGATSSGHAGTGTGPIFDVGVADETGAPDCTCGNQLGFSYIWIANSSQSSVSKINTATMVEEGRYVTSAGFGDPSRTSVNLSGRAVAVANRTGGVVKIWSRPEFCDPGFNGEPGLQTSTGAADVLPWGEDDCVAWYAPFEYTSQRPIAWAGGVVDPDTCETSPEVVWTSGCAPGLNVQVHRLDGGTGTVLDTVDVEGFPCTVFGGYGGAVDGAGNFWITNTHGEQPQTLARIDAVSLAADRWTPPIGAYGMTVDRQGRPWLQTGFDGPATALRFDPDTETWASAPTTIAPAARRGSRRTPRAACG